MKDKKIDVTWIYTHLIWWGKWLLSCHYYSLFLSWPVEKSLAVLIPSKETVTACCRASSILRRELPTPATFQSCCFLIFLLGPTVEHPVYTLVHPIPHITSLCGEGVGFSLSLANPLEGCAKTAHVWQTYQWGYEHKYPPILVFLVILIAWCCCPSLENLKQCHLIAIWVNKGVLVHQSSL